MAPGRSFFRLDESSDAKGHQGRFKLGGTMRAGRAKDVVLAFLQPSLSNDLAWAAERASERAAKAFARESGFELHDWAGSSGEARAEAALKTRTKLCWLDETD